MLGKEIASYDLQLSSPCIYLPIRQQNESSECLTGQFCLSLARAAHFKGIKVQLVGKMKTPRYGVFVAQDREEITFERSQALAFSKTRNAFTMPAGNYEFPFEIPLSGLRFDTLVGPNHEYYTYHVEVTVERWMWRDLVVSQPVRIYRYPKFDIGRGMPKSVAGHSNQDLAYHFSIPDTLIPHGGTFPVDCWFIPLSKSLTVTGITVRIIEKHELSFPATAAESVQYSTYFITSSESHVIFEEKHDFTVLGGALSSGKDADVQQISMPVRLPGDPGACSQSYSSRKIKINHVLLVTVECIDGAGECVKMLAEAIPLHIYMRPTGKGKDSQGPTSSVKSDNCPPVYGEHQLDLMILDPKEVEGDDQVPSITLCPGYAGVQSGEADL